MLTIMSIKIILLEMNELITEVTIRPIEYFY